MSFVRQLYCTVLDNNCKLFKSWKKKKFMIGSWTSKQEEENQESSVEKETELGSVMLKTFHHICI